MLEPYRGEIRNIAFLYAHLGPPDREGGRFYEICAARVTPERPDEFFSSPVRYGRFTERERHASGLSREILRDAPPLPDVAAFLGTFLRGTEILLTLLPREEIAELLDACGNPRVVDLGFAAEFFLPEAENTSLKTLWEQLQGKGRDKLSFSAREAVDLSLDLVRRICGRVLNPDEFPPAAALRHYLAKSDTLFGDLFGQLSGRYRDYFGGLFTPATGGDTPDWQGFLETAPPPAPPAAGGTKGKPIPLAGVADLYRGLAASHRHYTLRPAQIDYARQVAAALNDHAILTIEAGTGTGKTQGYLIPLLEFLRRNPTARAAVSTYTKSLQEQIVRREIPLSLSLNVAYRKIPVVLLKGKSNYLCAEKLDHLYEETLRGGRLLAWLYFVHRLFHFRTAEGDAVGPRIRHHLHDGFFFRRLQQEGSARSGCTRRHRRCPAQVVAAEAANARLIVTNHHKLALLNRDEALAGLFSHYLIDEANHFEQAVRGAFAVEIGSRAIADTLTYLESVLGRLAPAPDAAAPDVGTAALAAAEAVRQQLARLAEVLAVSRAGAASGESAVLPAEHPAFAGGCLPAELDALRRPLRQLAAGLSFLKDAAAGRSLGLHPRTVDRMKTALKDLQDQAETLKAIGEKTALPGYVTAGIVFVRHWSISLAAVEVAGLLQDHIYDGRQSVVFTSATLRNGEGFDDFRRIAGIPERAADPSAGSAAAGAPDPAASPATPGRDFRFAAFPSPFSPEAAEIVVPPGAISGAFEQKALWLRRVVELLPGLIRQNRGRTLVLFASYSDLGAVVREVSEAILADGYPLLIQKNGAPTAPLCEEFRAIRESVLFGVDTFWYGVDFPGETLTQVIITRLPFPHPHDPLQIARRNLLPREEYWRRYRYEAAIKLRQGIGRLIRSEADHGRVVILDARYRILRTPGGAA
jgi:ATP-dependent DNA helicase DinG